MSRVEEWLLENKNKIEKGVEMIGEGCEVLATSVGKFHPFLEAVFMATAQLLRDPGSTESRYLTEQFQKLDRKLATVKDEVDSIARELQRTSMNKQNFDCEAQIISQYEKFQDFLSAQPDFREKKKEKFLSHFECTGGDLNLDTLYNAITSTEREPILETVLETEQKSRRAVEAFCSALKKLFVMGIIAIMGQAALEQGLRREAPVEGTLAGDALVEEALVNKWKERMEDVERRMKAAVDYCTENFASQAKDDMERQLLEKEDSDGEQFIEPLLTFLSTKYDWVSWSIRVVSHSGLRLWNRLAGKEYHGSNGSGNVFEVPTKGKITVFVSFSVQPTPIDKELIKEQIESQQLRGKMSDVALTLGGGLPNCAVYTISRYKDVRESNTFPEGCYYFAEHRRAYVCVHSK
ncbi:protein rapunzel-like [Scleropages formosus]|uniref:Protein rapunzel-like n=1 Tax=Scleropages formosus TaxID=113540 RepID=A0A8C9RD77_SCLFO|nr:protein rapunzel-like [Scleropages formosus]